MSFLEKRRSGLSGGLNTTTTTTATTPTTSSTTASTNVPRRSQGLSTSSSASATPRTLHPPSLSPSPVSTSTQPVVPLRRSHSSLNKFSPGHLHHHNHHATSTPNSLASSNSSSHICLAPQRYLDVPDAASMITAQRRTPSSASLLFGTMSSTSTPAQPVAPVSSNYRRLAGNIPGTATNVLKIKSGPFRKPDIPTGSDHNHRLLHSASTKATPSRVAAAVAAGTYTKSSSTTSASKTTPATPIPTKTPPTRVDFKLQQSTEDEDSTTTKQHSSSSSNKSQSIESLVPFSNKSGRGLLF